MQELLNFLDLQSVNFMVLAQDIDVTTLDSSVWEVAKYFLVLFVGMVVWLGALALTTIKSINLAINSMAVDIAVMKSNSDNTKSQLVAIRHDIENVTEKLGEHERRILHIERQIKVS